MKQNKLFNYLFLFVFSFLTPLFINAEERPASPPNEQGLKDFIQQFNADYGALSRFYSLPWSEMQFDRMEQFYKESQKKISELNFSQLNQQERIDYLLLKNSINFEIIQINKDRKHLSEMDPLLPFRKPIQKLEQARWRMNISDPKFCADVLSVLPEQINKLMDRIKKPGKDEKKADAKTKKSKDIIPIEISPVIAKRTASAVDNIKDTLNSWYAFYKGFQPDFSWWVDKPYNETTKALTDYTKYLREKIAGIEGKDEDPLIGEPAGRDALLDNLANEMIPYTPEELISIGEKEFAWCEKEIEKTAKEMGFNDWKMALSKVKSNYASPGKQNDLIAKIAHDAINFVREKELVTVPALCEETWRLSMLSPGQQKTIPYAAYSGQKILVAYAHEDMKQEDKLMSMRGNNRSFMHIVTAHELIPGHHLQNFVSSRNHAYRAIFSSPFHIEGWALYSEMMLWNNGYGKTPEDRIGMLFWRMHRCARIIVSLKFHLNKMNPSEMINFLMDKVGHERLGAASEVRRYIGEEYSPLYQSAYMIGGLQIMKLRSEMTGTGKMTEKEFNDTVLTYHSIPIEFIRAGMKDIPLTPDAKPVWKFMTEK